MSPILQRSKTLSTECNTVPITWSSLQRVARGDRLEFNGGPITSDAGALLLREADQRLRRTERTAACLCDPRSQDWIVHEQQTLVAQRILGLACGWEDRNDHPRLRQDPRWQILMGQKQRPFTRAAYRAGTWDRARPLIIKAEHNGQGPNPRFWVSHLPREPGVLYAGRYCGSGQMENYIKQQWRCSRIAPVAQEGDSTKPARLPAGPARPLAGRADTIRLKLFKIGAVVRTSLRRLVLPRSGDYPLRELFRLVCRRLRAIPLPTRSLAAVQLNTS